MLRLGNDIVDLACGYAENKYSDKRFLFRVFTQKERQVIASSHDKTRIIWSLWSAKEAAFKACIKQFPDTFFSPQQFSVTERSLQQLIVGTTEKLVGTLDYFQHTFTIIWQWQMNYVHAVGILTTKTLAYDHIIHSSVFNINENCTNVQHLRCSFSSVELESIFSTESLQTRFYAKAFLYTLGYPEQIELIRRTKPHQHRKRLMYPQLSMGNVVLRNHEISLSHDAPWAAIAVMPPTPGINSLSGD